MKETTQARAHTLRENIKDLLLDYQREHRILGDGDRDKQAEKLHDAWFHLADFIRMEEQKPAAGLNETLSLNCPNCNRYGSVVYITDERVAQCSDCLWKRDATTGVILNEGDPSKKMWRPE